MRGHPQLELKPLYRAEGLIGFLSRLTPQAHALEGYRRLLMEGGGVVDVLPCGHPAGHGGFVLRSSGVEV